MSGDDKFYCEDLTEVKHKMLELSGYATFDDVRNATDGELEMVPMIGKGTITKIRLVAPCVNGVKASSPPGEFTNQAAILTLLSGAGVVTYAEIEKSTGLTKAQQLPAVRRLRERGIKIKNIRRVGFMLPGSG